MIAYSRGSRRLAGAASLKYGVPAMVGPLAPLDIAHLEEQQPQKLLAAGSNPAIQFNALNKRFHNE